MGLTPLKVCLALVLVMAVAAHSENHGPVGLRERGREARQGPGRDHVREASPRDGPRIRREPPPPQRHHYGPGPPGPPSSGPRPSKSSAYGPPHSHGHGHAGHHSHGPSSKPRYGPPPQSAPPKHRTKPVYGPKGKGKGHSHGHVPSHGPSHGQSHGLDSFEATSTYDRPTRQSYGPSKSGYGHPTRGSGSKPHRPKATYSLSGSGAGGYGGPSKPSYGPPSKPSKPHSGNKYRKNKYRGQKPVYGPSKPFKPSSSFGSPPSSTYAGPPSSTYSSPSSSSAEYSPSEPSTPSHLVNSYGEPAQHGVSANYAPSKVSSSSTAASLAHSAESGSGSYEDTSSYDASYSSYSKPQQHGDGNTEIQPSISYTLLPTYGGGSTLSPDHKPSSSGGSFHDSYKQKTPYSYRAPYDAGTSFKNPISHGGAATSYISVNHPGATAQPPASEEASAFGYGSASSPASASVSPGASHGQAVLTTGYRAPDSSYEGSANYASSKPAAATYYSSIPAYGRQQGQAQSQGYRQQQYGDIQTAGSSIHSQQVQPAAAENFQAPAEVFGFVPYKSVAVSASVNTQGSSASIPIHVPSHAASHGHAANEVQAAAPTQSTTPNFAGGLSPQDWDAYYGDSSKQAKPQQPQQQQQQSDVLSPNYYDPLPQQEEEEQHQQQHHQQHQQQQQQQTQQHQDPYGSKVGKHRHSSNSRKKDTTQAHLKMLLQQRAQQQQQANKRYSQQAQVLAQQQQQQHASARDSYATEEDAEEAEDGDADVEDSRRR